MGEPLVRVSDSKYHLANVKRGTTNSLARILGVALVMVAWFGVSNHCGLAGLVADWQNADAAHAQATDHRCCQDDAGSTERLPDTAKVCCKVLRGVPIDSGAKLVLITAALPLFELDWLDAESLTADSIARSKTGTGPPHSASFAETILQRSILSHAPPSLG